MYFYQISPLVYALLIGKETNDYNKFFEQLLLKHDYEPESILVDFENAALKSTKIIFSDAIQLSNFKLYAFYSKTDCCYESRLFFHFGQCIWREIQPLGLQNKYTIDENFRINVKKLMGLAYVPVLDVIKAYSSIATDFDVEENDLLNYFERVWVGPKKGKDIFTL